jgi:hypothetical protein
MSPSSFNVPRMVRGISPVGTDSGLSWSFKACWSTYLPEESRGEQQRRTGGEPEESGREREERGGKWR